VGSGLWVGMNQKLKTGADGEGMDGLKRGFVGETEDLKNKC
jgi:hypothetical protein